MKLDHAAHPSADLPLRWSEEERLSFSDPDGRVLEIEVESEP